jgi:molybdopterin converting factor subunit 1
MATIQIQYFAVLREHVGMGGEEVTTRARSVAELFDELDARHGFPDVGQLKVAINDEFAAWDASLADGDSVVFIPPVAGG